tara:strand:- start:1722 stop:2600 length:879 start_codon:yes stop_codon:yes gene_type:complete
MLKSYTLLFFDLVNLSYSLIKYFFSLKETNDNKFKINLNPSKKLLILGNGPSLKKDIERIKNLASKSDIFAVNYFASSEYFRKLKPKCYFIFDPMFFSDEVNIDLRRNTQRLYEDIKKIDWNMVIICNKDGYPKLKKIFKKNKYVSVFSIVNRTKEFNIESIHLFSLKHNITTPNFGRGVLILALWYAILIKKNDIEIYGADFSQFKDFEVDQSTNKTILDNTHFYKVMKGQEKNRSKYKNKKDRKIHERLYELSLMFKNMYLISKVAKKRHLKIINFSSNSYLDCFERPKK